MGVGSGAWNLGAKAARRAATLHKPLVRLMRRRQRAGEHAAFERETAAAERAIARVASGSAPIVAGPWLGEVGYEVLYWIPFLRWFVDAYRIDPARLTVLSRGGMDAAYADLAGAYVDLFDLLTPPQFASRNAARQQAHEGGGQKQSALAPLDEELIAGASARLGLDGVQVLHPSLMFAMFRHAWHGNAPMDVFWSRTRYTRLSLADAALPAGVSRPAGYTAVKLYGGPALSLSGDTLVAVKTLVARAAAAGPVVLLSTAFGVDEHRDADLHDIPGVIDAGPWMTPRTNLGVQLALIAGGRGFLGTCGGLAWLAPFLDVPTVAVYDSDHLLAPHLLVARQAGKRAGAAEFATVDLRAARRLGLP